MGEGVINLSISSNVAALALKYAPVNKFLVELIAGCDGPSAVGFAAPLSGKQPCAVALVVEQETLAIARATRYSKDADHKYLRFGWCGFRLDGLGVAGAIDDKVELRCVVSGATLATWQSLELLSGWKRSEPKPAMTVVEIISTVRRSYGVESSVQLLSFANQIRESRGEHGLVEFAYKWLLKRSPPMQEIENLLTELTTGWTFIDLVDHFLASEEFLNSNKFFLLGPFEPDFPFDLSFIWP